MGAVIFVVEGEQNGFTSIPKGMLLRLKLRGHVITFYSRDILSMPFFVGPVVINFSLTTLCKKKVFFMSIFN